MKSKGKITRRDLIKSAGIGAAWVFMGGFMKLKLPATYDPPGAWGDLMEYAVESWPEDLVAVHMIHVPPPPGWNWGMILLFGIDEYDSDITQGYLYHRNPDLDSEEFVILSDLESAVAPDPRLKFADDNFFCGGHELLPDGRVLLAGGSVFGHEDIGIPTAAVFDLPYAMDNGTNNAWRQLPDMDYARWYPSVTVLSDGQMLVTAGKIDNDPEEHADMPEVLTLSSTLGNSTWAEVDAWIDRGSTPPKPGNWDPYPMMFAIYDKHETSSRRKAIAVGKRRRDDQPSNGTKSWKLDVDVQSNENGWYVRDNNDAVLQGGCAAMWIPATAGQDPPTGWIIKTGGRQGTSATDKTTWLDLDDVHPLTLLGTWKEIGTQYSYPDAPPFLNYARTNHNMVWLPTGHLAVIGGATVPEQYETGPGFKVLQTEAWNPFDPQEEWEIWASSPDERMYHSSAVLLCDGSVLVGGGGLNSSHGQSPFDQHNGRRFLPPYFQAQGDTPEITGMSPDGIVWLGSTFTVETEYPNDVAMVSLIKLGSTTHGLDMGQRFINVSFSVFQGSLLCTSPQYGGIAPPGYYMLFLVSDEGKPSYAKYVQVLPFNDS